MMTGNQPFKNLGEEESQEESTADVRAKRQEQAGHVRGTERPVRLNIFSNRENERDQKVQGFAGYNRESKGKSGPAKEDLAELAALHIS